MGCGSSAQPKYVSCDGQEAHASTVDSRTSSSGSSQPQLKKQVTFSERDSVHSIPPIGANDTAPAPAATPAPAPSPAPAPNSMLAFAFIANVPVLQSLNQKEQRSLLQAMTTTSYQSGEVVIKQGSINNRLFVIFIGKAEVVLSENSSETRLATLAAGDYFGEQEFLHEDVARATVRALDGEGLVTYSISHNTLWKLQLHEKLRLPKRRAMISLPEVAQNRLIKDLAPSKEQADVNFIKESLHRNASLSSFCELTDDLVSELAAAACLRTVAHEEVLMTQGDIHGNCFYIVKSGALEIRGCGRQGAVCKLPGTWESRAECGHSFGELELLYAMPCAATVTALENSAVWAINSSDFALALEHELATRRDKYAEVLQGVQIFKGLFKEELRALAATVTEVKYQKGEDIITQGEIGDTCFVLVDGEVVVLVEGVEVASRLAMQDTNKAELFGHEELVHPRPRIATVRVASKKATVLALDKTSFELVLEPLSDILYAVNASGNTRKPACKENATQKIVKQLSNVSASLAMNCTELKLLGNLASGDFGSVELVEREGSGERFALKRVLRSKMTESGERRRLLSEKTVLSMITSPFAVRLYGTCRDVNALSFLLELVPGGDLYQAYCLKDCYGNLPCAQFYTAGIALALEHLHGRRIVHRDLKLENVLLDSAGWPKVTDFGLAKLCVEKTFTRCGTPNYMAPEILTEVGHGAAVDWWSLGILVYEMMAASTPFESPDGDFLKTCRLSLQGIPSPKVWLWPAGFGESLCSIVCGLLQPNPLRRLPMQPGGVQQFKEHAWFDGFNWDDFEGRALQPPILPAALIDENLPPSQLDEDWHSAPLPDTDWDVDF